MINKIRRKVKGKEWSTKHEKSEIREVRPG
jgi:hypothetical protein